MTRKTKSASITKSIRTNTKVGTRKGGAVTHNNSQGVSASRNSRGGASGLVRQVLVHRGSRY